MKTMGQVRREEGIPESDYIRRGDDVDVIATIRTLVRWFGPPDHRTDHIESRQLHWTVADKRYVVVKDGGGITS